MADMIIPLIFIPQGFLKNKKPNYHEFDISRIKLIPS